MKGLGGRELLTASSVTFEGQQLSPEQLQGACGALPFLAEKRLVVVSGLLGRFERRSNKSWRRKKAAAADQQDDFIALAACIQQLPESTVLVLIDGKIRPDNQMLKEIAVGAIVKYFPLLREPTLRRWIEQRVAEEGSSISTGAVELLARLVGGNLWAMTNEVNKLVLFASGRRIEEADVSLVVSHSQETNVFAMVDAIIESRAKAAGQKLRQLLEKGVAPAYLMAMLQRQLQMIVRAKELATQRRTEIEIQRRLGLHKFATRRTLEQAANCPQKRLVAMYHKLLETDLAIKTGRRDDELALTILVVELCG